MSDQSTEAMIQAKGLIGTIETEQADLATRLEHLHSLINELRNIA